MGFRQSFTTPEDCVAMYVDTGVENECGYLSQFNISSSVALEEFCQLLCDLDENGTPALINHKTETIVYKLGEATTTTDFRGGSSNFQAPDLVEVQRIPSMGVIGLHSFTFEQTATQESYEACESSVDSTVPCFEQAGLTKPMLVVINHDSSCEHDLVNDRINPADERRQVEVFEWNSETMLFQSLTRIESNCQAVSVHDFTTRCNEVATNPAGVPACNAYLAVAENCEREVELGNMQSNMRITFHRWDTNGTTLSDCQPYDG